MKIKEKIKISCLLFLIVILTQGKVLATIDIRPVEYTDEFKNYLNLSKEERAKVLMPRLYSVPNTKTSITNPLRLIRLRGALSSEFNLKNIISDNVVVKDQMETGSCWAFASLAALETNLAMQNYYNGYTPRVYDFSERHVEYTTSRFFANNEINTIGYNRRVGDGGQYYLAEQYLINGYGAINEEDMPFENNEDLININSIKNKEVQTKVNDTVWFPSESPNTITADEINAIKEHIKTNGAVYAGIHGGDGVALGGCYNNETGALYCDNSILYPIDHAIAIVGWDDNYSINNFNEDSRPSSNGAWIAKNSWGENIEIGLDQMKEAIFANFEEQCREQNWNSPEEIPDDFTVEFFIANGFNVQDNKIIYNVGDHGYFHISYEDANVYLTLWGIEKSTTEFDNYNKYYYNEYVFSNDINITGSTVYLGNVFSKKSSGKEYLTEVAIFATETYTCTVLVNPNGSSMANSDLQQVALKTGTKQTINPGYHTLELLEPLEITGNNFSVVIKIQSTRTATDIALESKVQGIDTFNVVNVETGKCFATTEGGFENNQWDDLSKISQVNPMLAPGDSTVRAFTVNNIVDNSLNRIEITTPPNKTSYFVGENFNKTGMVVTAYYNNGNENEITEYDVINGTSLAEGQTSVTIKYEDKTATQNITVEKNGVTNLVIITPPNKVLYKAGHDFDRTGMRVKAIYKNGEEREITDFDIKNGLDLKNGQTSVTISYYDVEVEQEITVEPNPVVKIEIKKEPDKTEYIVGQDFESAGMIVEATYEDELVKEISSYTIINGENLTIDQTEVIISFEDKQVTQQITVEEKRIESISVKQEPTKTTYIKNKEQLDLSGGIIEITYNDGSKEQVAMDNEDVEVTGFSNKNIGTITITIKYENKTTTFTVTIVEEETPKNSNFDNANVGIDNIKLFTYTDKTKEEYELIEISISNIVRNPENDGFDYYYYLSTKEKEENIEGWIKIDRQQDDSEKLTFSIDTRDLDNYLELVKADSVYLYIKEVARKGGNQKVAIFGGFKVDEIDNAEIYVDDVKQGSLDTGIINNNGDPTTANKIIPKTGSIFKSIGIIFIILVSIMLFIKYRRYKDI